MGSLAQPRVYTLTNEPLNEICCVLRGFERAHAMSP